MLWYLPKGEKQPTSISILAGANVGQLKRALKTDMREEYGLDIPAAKLQIYVTSVDAQARALCCSCYCLLVLSWSLLLQSCVVGFVSSLL